VGKFMTSWGGASYGRCWICYLCAGMHFLHLSSLTQWIEVQNWKSQSIRLALSFLLFTVPMSLQYETALCPAVQAPCILYIYIYIYIYIWDGVWISPGNGILYILSTNILKGIFWDVLHRVCFCFTKFRVFHNVTFFGS